VVVQMVCDGRVIDQKISDEAKESFVKHCIRMDFWSRSPIRSPICFGCVRCCVDMQPDQVIAQLQLSLCQNGFRDSDLMPTDFLPKNFHHL